MLPDPMTPFHVNLLLYGRLWMKCSAMSSMAMSASAVVISTSRGDRGRAKHVLRSPMVMMVACGGHCAYASWRWLMSVVLVGAIYPPRHYFFVLPEDMHHEMTLCPYFRMFSMVMSFLSRKHSATPP